MVSIGPRVIKDKFTVGMAATKESEGKGMTEKEERRKKKETTYVLR